MKLYKLHVWFSNLIQTNREIYQEIYGVKLNRQAKRYKQRLSK